MPCRSISACISRARSRAAHTLPAITNLLMIVVPPPLAGAGPVPCGITRTCEPVLNSRSEPRSVDPVPAFAEIPACGVATVRGDLVPQARQHPE
jgi:hypothetical protein